MPHLLKYITPLNVVGTAASSMAIFEVIFRDTEGEWIAGVALLAIFIIIPCFALNVIIGSNNITRTAKLLCQFGVLLGYVLFVLSLNLFVYLYNL